MEADLVLDSREVRTSRHPCSACERHATAYVCCVGADHCRARHCWRCWVDRLEFARGRVSCEACGSVYGGFMSLYEVGEFQTVWIEKFGYSSWAEAEAADQSLAPTNIQGSPPPTSESSAL
jgi:hypothetical protein